MDSQALSERETVEVVEGVHLTQLTAGERTSLQRFRIEPGATVPKHSHHHEQTGYVFRGTLVFLLDGEEVAVGPDESFTLPGGEPHAAENRGDVPVEGVDIFSPPRPNPDWEE